MHLTSCKKQKGMRYSIFCSKKCLQTCPCCPLLLLQEVFWREDWAVLCLAWMVHWDAVSCSSSWPFCVSLWYFHNGALPGQVNTDPMLIMTLYDPRACSFMKKSSNYLGEFENRPLDTAWTAIHSVKVLINRPGTPSSHSHFWARCNRVPTKMAPELHITHEINKSLLQILVVQHPSHSTQHLFECLLILLIAYLRVSRGTFFCARWYYHESRRTKCQFCIKEKKN